MIIHSIIKAKNCCTEGSEGHYYIKVAPSGPVISGRTGIALYHANSLIEALQLVIFWKNEGIITAANVDALFLENKIEGLETKPVFNFADFIENLMTK